MVKKIWPNLFFLYFYILFITVYFEFIVIVFSCTACEKNIKLFSLGSHIWDTRYTTHYTIASIVCF
jgi:hypothetical protein